jgi:catechol 2,3-dioxygenase-like lactoylglutathione lyase family enzyme
MRIPVRLIKCQVSTVLRLRLIVVAVIAASFAGGVHASSAGAAPIPGVLGIDHMGITVPNAAQARRWFVNVAGCSGPLNFGPFADPKGSLMKDLLGVRPRAVVEHISEVRCGSGSSIELLQYKAPGQNKTVARNSDFAGHHVAFYVTDLPKAIAYMDSRGVKRFMGPFPVTMGPAAGQSINYFKTPFGLYVELISYPNGMAYEQTAATKLWNPQDIGAAPGTRGIPGLLGVDHFGVTVPKVAAARKWLENVAGCTTPLRFGPISDPVGDLMKNLLEVNPRAVIQTVNELRCGPNGANLELFQYSSPDQSRRIPLNSDRAASHIAFYVKDINRSVRAMRSSGAKKFLGPFPVTGGPAAGQTINYFYPRPLGRFIELISYPHGMAYERQAKPPLWSPRKPGS